MSDDEKELDVSYGFVEKEDEAVTEYRGFKAPYIKNNDKATDYRFSGYLLTVVGGIGCLFVVLSIFGIIPRYLGNPYLSYGVLFAVFVLFLVMGIISVRSAGGFEIKAKSDNLLEKRILDYVREEITPQVLDEGADIEEGDEPEIMFFKRTDRLKTMINKKFVNINPDFLEDLIDEKIYDLIYEEKDK